MDDDFDAWLRQCIMWVLMVSALIIGLAALSGCQSTNTPKWQMYRLDKHYQPHRVL